MNSKVRPPYKKSFRRCIQGRAAEQEEPLQAAFEDCKPVEEELFEAALWPVVLNRELRGALSNIALSPLVFELLRHQRTVQCILQARLWRTRRRAKRRRKGVGVSFVDS
jgi:hypothetical protein